MRIKPMLLVVALLLAACESPTVREARLRIESGDLESARKLLEAETRTNPRDEDAWLLLGRVFLRAADPEAASEAFTHLGRLDSDANEKIAVEYWTAAREMFEEPPLPSEPSELIAGYVRKTLSLDPSTEESVLDWIDRVGVRSKTSQVRRWPVALLKIAWEKDRARRPLIKDLLLTGAEASLGSQAYADTARYAATIHDLLKDDKKAADLLKKAAIGLDSIGRQAEARAALRDAMQWDASLTGDLDTLLLRSKLGQDLPSEKQPALPSMGEPRFSYQWKETLADIARIARAVEAFATENNQYPDARDIDDLARILSAGYDNQIQRTDVWGTPFLYLTSPNHSSYRIVSAGEDQTFSEASRRIEDTPLVISENLRSDIIYQNGAFVQRPRQDLVAGYR